MEITRKMIFDALISDSSADGCDPDWRHEVLTGADPALVAEIRAEIGKNDETEGETELRLGREGRLR